MKIELIIANWLLVKLKNENLIDNAVSDDVMKRFLQSLSRSVEDSVMESEAA